MIAQEKSKCRIWRSWGKLSRATNDQKRLDIRVIVAEDEEPLGEAIAGEDRLELVGRNDGSEFPADVSLTADETNEGCTATEFIHDLSERRASDAMLRKNAKQALLGSAPDAVVIVDATGDIFFARRRLAARGKRARSRNDRRVLDRTRRRRRAFRERAPSG
jgi:hypothetical protein